VLELAVGVAVGFLAGRTTWLAARPWFNQPALARPNYRGRYIPVGVGLVIPIALFLVEAGRAVAGAAGVGDDPGIGAARMLTLVVVTGFCLLGAIDDVAGSGEYRGFKGHILALAAGQLTTGLFKLLGGAAVALVVAGPVAGDSLGRLLADASLIALSANLGNLLDRVPGRTTKASIAAFAVLAILASARPALSGVAVVIGAGAALLRDDLREHLMLGDAGANALGAALGMGVVMSTGAGTRTFLLVVVAVLNALGEVVSFSKVIDALPPLRALDQMGRRPAERRPSR
jgi:UDP-N-acetylmuramyl pentapeptide phosphotransferase/UDP-N-acetylglucosamine-1-phosphate transferase